MNGKLYDVKLSSSDLIIIRQALREFRTNVPANIADDAQRIARWAEMREIFSSEIVKLDNLSTTLLASEI